MFIDIKHPFRSLQIATAKISFKQCTSTDWCLSKKKNQLWASKIISCTELSRIKVVVTVGLLITS